MIDFWFGDQERFERDKEYGQSRLGKWFGFGPEDDRFLETQHASKELIVKAARYLTYRSSPVLASVNRKEGILRRFTGFSPSLILLLLQSSQH